MRTPFQGSPRRRVAHAIVALLIAHPLTSCSKKSNPDISESPPATAAAAKKLKVGLVTDVGGRGDQSFNDSALRGLELWAAGKRLKGATYEDASTADMKASFPPELAMRQPPIRPLPITPLVLQSKSQEDYEPNLQLLVDQGAALIIGAGFMVENAIEATAKRNPGAKFLLLDSPILDARGNPYTLPNVRTVCFREEEGSFLVGALAGLVTHTGKIGFIGGMEVPLIKKFESGFRAGALSTNPKAGADMARLYTGSFDNVAAGKQLAQDLLAKGTDVIFQAAGSDGLGVIQAVKEARTSGKPVFVIGVDSDQWHLAPEAVLTSMVKRVDLAVYESIRDLVEGRFQAGDVTWGLKENGIGLAEVRAALPTQADALTKIDHFRTQIVGGRLSVPASDGELSSFKATP